MQRIDIENNLKDLNAMVINGQALEAFEKYYHEDVVMQENEALPTVSKAANRAREIEFFNNIISFRSAVVEGLAVGDAISYVSWAYDYTHKEWGVRNYRQVSVQQWKDGKIIHEKFIYNS